MSISQTEGLETYNIKGGLKVIERYFDLPLDYSKPEGTKIKIFARQVIPTDKAKTLNKQSDLPIVVYLQGGPGYEIPFRGRSGFAGELYKNGYQVLWIDQRGTGLSTALSPDTVPSHIQTPRETADYIKHFLARNIVRDCETIRRILLGNRPNEEDRKWTILGQSWGGWLSLTYLSFHPEGLKEVWLTGGLAPIALNEPGEVYKRLIPRLAKRNAIYYQKYPADIARIRKIAAYLDSNDVVLPNGTTLSITVLQLLGMSFGAKGGIDNVHQIIFRVAQDLEIFGKLSYKTLHMIEQEHGFDENPLYAILQEPIYCQGAPARWAAKRAFESETQFSWNHVKSLSDSEPLYLLGETMLPEMYDSFAGLRPWKEVAHILAEDDNWTPPFDLEQLAKNEVKVSAVTYYDDMYVDFDLAQDTARRVKNVEQYITNQHGHDGLRQDASDVIGKLIQLSKREYD
ncbi:alpha/beta-hydrolase [Ephemerocybe angulata]|uniref:Alpha/beta-hydrolase n=1 Tax=Ephemerocybe angulata TaxID=980116 RepID=A0A8H6HH86_9AGAR|nr:alpha/beta-hydrolase [Tulosesus angulatus]